MGTMRITDVRTHLVEASLPADHQVESGAGPKISRQAAIVQIVTDEGLSGVGSCSFGSVSFELTFVKAVVEGAFRPLLLGRDARHIERIWEDLYYGLILRSFGNRGVAIAVLSAIDVALWDIKGCALGVPVYDLLGGPVRDRMPVYASSVYWASPEESARAAMNFVDRGHTAVKMKAGRNPDTDIACIREVRRALPAHIELMVDANMGYTRDQALRVGRCLDELEISFFEEPLSVDDIEGHASLATALDTRIAAGENLYTRWGFQPFIESGGIDIVQPDGCRSGGMSEARRIIDLANAHHLMAAPHTFSDALTLAANLHLALASPSVFTVEVDETYNPLMTEMVLRPVEIADGAAKPPSGPGLGVDLSWDWIFDHPYMDRPGIGAGVRPGDGG
jgi:D-galactarolactone cycloisomerase